MVVNDNTVSLTPHGVIAFIASNRASTGCSYRRWQGLFTRLQDQVERCFRGPAETGETGLAEHLAQTRFTGLAPRPRPTSWDSELGVQMKVDAA